MHDHARGDVGALILQRCDALGIGACLLDPDGRPAASTRRPRCLGALMRTQRLIDALGGAGAGGIVESLPGVRLVTLDYTTTMGERGRVAAMVLDTGFEASAEFHDLCAQAAIDPHAACADLAPLVAGADRTAALVRRAMRGVATDVLVVHERDDTIASFSRQLGESFDTIDLLYSLGRSMHGPFDAGQFLGMVCGRLHATMSFAWVGVVFDDAPTTTRRLRGLVLTHGTPPVAPGVLGEHGTRLLRECHGAGMITSGSPFPGDDSTPQVVVQPVLCRGRGVGVLLCGGKHGDDPYVSSYDSQLMEATAGMVSSFADNLALYDDLHASFVGSVRSLSAAIDAKDRYTFGHSERVAWMARELAAASGLTLEQCERVHIAGLVHDVGKIGVPEGVLCKPGSLTEQEFAAIKQHPTIGHRILRDIPGFEDILPGVLHHHERYDGRGYPAGLAGEHIPLIARLIGVADTFDAMSSTRSYRPALSRDRVLAEIERCAGTQLDPRVAMLVRSIDLRGYDDLFNARRIEASAAA